MRETRKKTSKPEENFLFPPEDLVFQLTSRIVKISVLPEWRRYFLSEITAALAEITDHQQNEGESFFIWQWVNKTRKIKKPWPRLSARLARTQESRPHVAH